MSNIPATKICGCCKIEKLAADFPLRKKKSKHGREYIWLRLQCRECMNQKSINRYNEKRETILKRNKVYYGNNKLKINSYKKEWDAKNALVKKIKSKERYSFKSDEIKSKRKEYYKNNKEKVIAINNDYVKRNISIVRQKQRLNHRKRKQVDISYSILKILRSRVSSAIKRNGTKCMRTTKLVGCSMPELLLHLESLFLEGMSWGNYGKWHIDHKIPCASFDMSIQEEQLVCFNFKNLQPLWAVDNIKKGAKILWQ